MSLSILLLDLGEKGCSEYAASSSGQKQGTVFKTVRIQS